MIKPVATLAPDVAPDAPLVPVTEGIKYTPTAPVPLPHDPVPSRVSIAASEAARNGAITAALLSGGIFAASPSVPYLKSMTMPAKAAFVVAGTAITAFATMDRRMSADWAEPLDDRHISRNFQDIVMRHRVGLFTGAMAGSLGYGIYWNQQQRHLPLVQKANNVRLFLSCMMYGAIGGLAIVSALRSSGFFKPAPISPSSAKAQVMTPRHH